MACLHKTASKKHGRGLGGWIPREHQTPFRGVPSEPRPAAWEVETKPERTTSVNRAHGLNWSNLGFSRVLQTVCFFFQINILGLDMFRCFYVTSSRRIFFWGFAFFWLETLSRSVGSLPKTSCVFGKQVVCFFFFFFFPGGFWLFELGTIFGFLGFSRVFSKSKSKSSWNDFFSRLLLGRSPRPRFWRRFPRTGKARELVFSNQAKRKKNKHPKCQTQNKKEGHPYEAEAKTIWETKRKRGAKAKSVSSARKEVGRRPPQDWCGEGLFGIAWCFEVCPGHRGFPGAVGSKDWKKRAFKALEKPGVFGMVFLNRKKHGSQEFEDQGLCRSSGSLGPTLRRIQLSKKAFG